MNDLTNHPQNTVPSHLKANPKRESKEHCKAIILWSGKELADNIPPVLLVKEVKDRELAKKDEDNTWSKVQEESVVDIEPSKVASYKPPIPFPQHF